LFLLCLKISGTKAVDKMLFVQAVFAERCFNKECHQKVVNQRGKSGRSNISTIWIFSKIRTNFLRAPPFPKCRVDIFCRTRARKREFNSFSYTSFFSFAVIFSVTLASAINYKLSRTIIEKFTRASSRATR
jgi:hypothetical protein